MSATKPTVLVLDEEPPLPLDTGKRIRTFNLLSALAEDFQIEILVHDGPDIGTAAVALREQGIVLHAAPSRLPPKRGVTLALRFARSLLGPDPYSVWSHRRPGFAKEAARLLARPGGVDLLQVEWTPYAAYATTDAPPLVVAAHNVECEIWERLADREQRPLMKPLVRDQARRMRSFEKRVFQRVSVATAVSERDALAIREMGCRDVTVVPNGVDLEFFTPAADATPEPRSLIFTGSMDWRPNQDAIAWFAAEVHPLLLETGDYRLYVVGRNPPSWMTEPGGLPAQIIVTGRVDDVRGWVDRALVYVVPLRVGGGSRLKILEALAMKKATVSTTVGAEGLDISDGRDIVLRDEPRAFVDAVTSLWADAARRAALGVAGRAMVESRYGWKGIARIQKEVWRTAIARRSVAGG